MTFEVIFQPYSLEMGAVGVPNGPPFISRQKDALRALAVLGELVNIPRGPGCLTAYAEHGDPFTFNTLLAYCRLYWSEGHIRRVLRASGVRLLKHE